jgi:hypothetical protein
VSGRSLKIFQLFKNSPNQISGQQDRFLTRRATELVEYFLNLSCSWTLESLLRLSVEIKQLPQGGEISGMKLEVMHYFMHYFFKKCDCRFAAFYAFRWWLLYMDIS